MNDDIVARLRLFTANTADLPTVTDAADEIELLRFEILGLKDEIKRLREELLKYTGDGQFLFEPFTPEAL